MNQRSNTNPWWRGIVVAVFAMLLYTVALGFFLALALLIIAMEEGGSSLSSLVIPMTQMVVLLSQGVGFTIGSITLGVTPLLLSLLLIALIASLFERNSLDLRSFGCGLIIWECLNAYFLHGALGIMNDSFGIALLKTACIFILGYLWALIRTPNSYRSQFIELYKRLTKMLRHIIFVGISCAGIIIAIDVLIGLITVLVWIVQGNTVVDDIFTRMNMHTGSRIMMLIMAVAWLPNCCLWALSWLYGGGFSIGKAASYSLWSHTSDGLPSLPIFGYFPQAITNDTARICFLSIPFAIAFIIGYVILLHPKGFPIRFTNTRVMVAHLICCVISFCISAVTISLISTLLFWSSNGSLGIKRLQYVGVDIVQSARCVSLSTAWGLSAALIVAVISCALVYAIRWAISRFASRNNPAKPDATGTEEAGKHESITPRVVNSTPTMKEKQSDDNEPTVTTGIGIRLP